MELQKFMDLKKSEWHLVQYDKNPEKFICKMVTSVDIQWISSYDIQCQNGNQKEEILIHEPERSYKGYFVEKYIDKDEAVDKLKFLQVTCMLMLNSPHAVNDVMRRIHFDHNFWLLIMYTRVSMHGEDSIFAIFHKNDVILKRDDHTCNINAYVQEKGSACNGVVLKVSCDISELMLFMTIIKNDLGEMIRRELPRENRKRFSFVNISNMALKQDSNITECPNTSDIRDTFNIEQRLNYIAKCQLQCKPMFKRLKEIMEQIKDDGNLAPTKMEMSRKNAAVLLDHNYTLSNTSSGVSSASSSPPPHTASLVEHRFGKYFKRSAKRKALDDAREYQELSDEDENTEHSQEQLYPQQIGESIILGPNGTKIDMRSYSSILWSSAAAATRQLLSFVFTGDVLATHTLTGKPSPAFYGRERPPKMQLDPVKVADIIYCVSSRIKCTEREIRATITTKCSDTSKKYKRRTQKQLESFNLT